MRIHDTLSNSEKKLENSDKIGIYLCGVTVYDESHIGHARTIIVFDVLRRYLEETGVKVELVQNFTDVDDKIINRANKENTTPDDLSSRYIKSYFEDFDGLNIKRATIYPKATEHIEDIIEFIATLMEKNTAYTSKNGVYFAVSKFPKYGKLSKKKTDELQPGSRIEIDGVKADPLDFALWKFTDSEPSWESPWGRGRPGWHIECSSMSAKYLGQNFEIHGGGRDLIFPHHENEIAQSESCSGLPLAKIWMHVGMVTINGEKMSKSLGNIRSVKQILKNWGPNVTRLFCLSGHYSKPIDYSEDLLRESLTKWRQVETCLYELYNAGSESIDSDINKIAKAYTGEFDSALESDFNTHMALSSFFALIRETNSLAAAGHLGFESIEAGKRLERMMRILGLAIPKVTDDQKAKINELVSKREALRQEKKFKEADMIRTKLSQMNIELIDRNKKTLWIKREDIPADI